MCANSCFLTISIRRKLSLVCRSVIVVWFSNLTIIAYAPICAGRNCKERAVGWGGGGGGRRGINKPISIRKHKYFHSCGVPLCTPKSAGTVLLLSHLKMVRRENDSGIAQNHE